MSVTVLPSLKRNQRISVLSYLNPRTFFLSTPFEEQEEVSLAKLKRLVGRPKILDHLSNINRSYLEQYLTLRKYRVPANQALPGFIVCYLDLPSKEVSNFLSYTTFHEKPLTDTDLCTAARFATKNVFERLLVHHKINGGTILTSLLNSMGEAAVETFNYENILFLLNNIPLTVKNSFWTKVFEEVQKTWKDSPTGPLRLLDFYTEFYSRAPYEIIKDCLWDDTTDPILPNAFFVAHPKISRRSPIYSIAVKTLREALSKNDLYLFKLVYRCVTDKDLTSPFFDGLSLSAEFLAFLGDEDGFRALNIDKQIGRALGETSLQKLRIILQRASTPKRFETIFERALVSSFAKGLCLYEFLLEYKDLVTTDSWDPELKVIYEILGRIPWEDKEALNHNKKSSEGKYFIEVLVKIVRESLGDPEVTAEFRLATRVFLENLPS